MVLLIEVVVQQFLGLRVRRALCVNFTICCSNDYGEKEVKSKFGMILWFDKNILQRMNPQRANNREYSYTLNQLPFISDLKIQDLSSFIQITSQMCPQCCNNRKTHYCIQPKCKRNQLICWNCDYRRYESPHFMHEYTYALPLFCKNIFDNFQSITETLKKFKILLSEEIQKMKAYLEKLATISDMTSSYLSSLEQQYTKSNFESFKERIANFSKEFHGIKNFPSQLKDILNQVKFYSVQECHEKQNAILKKLLEKVNELKWLNDPQKELKLLLLSKEEEEKKDLFLSSGTMVEFSEIDHYFKINNQFYTENLKTHKIELKVESDFLNKTKYYEALVYHLRDVERMKIQNAHMSQIRSPLAFRNLKQIQFNCNTESEPSTLRIENISTHLESLTIRKLREEDLKNLKFIIQNSTSKMKEIHLQLYNKCDLSNNKELCECITACANELPELQSFYLKIRTESEVKRMYGYLSKFFKDSPEIQSQSSLSSSPLIQALQLLIKKCRKFTNITIEGLKGLVNIQLMESLESMPNLLNYRIYNDNIDLMSDLNPERNKILERVCQKRLNVVYIMARNSKFKLMPQERMAEIIEKFIV